MYTKSVNITITHFDEKNFNLANTYGNIGNLYLE